MASASPPSRDTLWFSSLLSGAYGSAAIALLFLAVDTVRGDPFATPSLMGSVLLFGASPSGQLPVRLDAVAYFSVVHLALFVALGSAATLLATREATLLQRPFLLVGAIATALTVGVTGLGTVLAPGLLGLIGVAPLLLGNAAAATVMAGMIRSTLLSTAPVDGGNAVWSVARSG